MSLKISCLGQIPASSTVINLSLDPAGMLWAASPAGLFCGKDQIWSPVVGNFPFTQVMSVLSVGKHILATGLTGGMVLGQDDRGRPHWQYCSLEQVTQPVTCLVASPNFDLDQVVLGGTAGDGLIRSVNGGRSWNLVNFGLRDFHILSLAVSKIWRQREPVFAGTTNGVFFSPNGGRAWRYAGLEGSAVLCLGLHQDFPQKPVVLAGTEAHGLWRSLDGGRTWEQIKFPGHDKLTFNALYAGDQGWVLSTDEEGVLISEDDGCTWVRANTELPPVLCLSGSQNVLFAGAYLDGVYRSTDHGKTWEKLPHWVAQRFMQLAIWEHEHGSSWLALAPHHGVWISHEPVRNWGLLFDMNQDQSWYCMANCQGSLFLGGEPGVRCVSTPGEAGEICLPTSQPVLSLAADDGQVFAATAAGELWYSADVGKHWEMIPSPQHGLPIISISVLRQTEGCLLTVAVLNEKKEEINIWHIHHKVAGASVDRWELWLSEKTIFRSAVMLLEGENGDKSWIGIGNSILFRHAGEWKRCQLDSGFAPVSVMIKAPRGEGCVVVAGDEVYTGELPGVLEKIPGDSRVLTDLQRPIGVEALYGLTSCGEVIGIE